MLRKLILAISAAFLACAPAHAQTGSAKTPAVLNSEVNALWPDNCVGCITPFNSRQTLLDIIASYSAYVPIIVVTTPVTLTTLQSAINTACAAGNAIVQIPTGSWSIDTTSSAINISSCPSIIIQGSGGITSGAPNGSLLTNTVAANDLFNVTTNGSVVFRDFAISASVTKSPGTALIRLNNTSTGLSQQVIERLSIFGGCNAIEIDNSFQFIVADNLIASSTCEGIVITQPTLADQGNNIVRGNKIWDVAGNAGADACILWHRGSGVRIEGNRCLGAFNYGLHIQFDNTFGDDGALIAIGNTFEVQKLSGIFLERTAGALAAGKKIGQMVFSGNFIQEIAASGTGAINIAASGGAPWVQGCVITGNSIQDNITPTNNAVIEIDGADQCVVADNMIYTTGGAGAGIRVAGNSTNTKILNNSNDGTTAATKYPALNSTTTLLDMAGMTVANLPSAAGNGSMVYVTDGALTNPITGSGTGTVAVRVNGAWVAAGIPPAPPQVLAFTLKSVNFNSAATDNALTITLPPGITRWRVNNVAITNASQTLSTATIGVFTGAAGTGQTIAANQAITVTATAAQTNNNMQNLTLTNATSEAYDVTTIQIRIGTAQGAPATGDVIVGINILS